MLRKSMNLSGGSSGIQFDNLLDKLLIDEDHRAIAFCKIRANRGKEGAEVIKLLKARAALRGIRVGAKAGLTVEMQDRWCEVSVEVWLLDHYVEKPLAEITMQDLKSALNQYDDEETACLTLITSRIFDGFPDVRSVEQTLNELLAANGRSNLACKTRIAVWKPGLQWITLRLQPPGTPELDLGDDYPIPSPPAP